MCGGPFPSGDLVAHQIMAVVSGYVRLSGCDGLEKRGSRVPGAKIRGRVGEGEEGEYVG